MYKNVNRFSFVGASLSLMVTYVTSAVPIPLYGTYQLEDHVSYLGLPLSSVIYFIGAVTALLKPSFTLPPFAKKAYPLAACTFVCTWALGGFFQAFGPAMAREQLHSQSAVAAALVFASIMAPSVIGASIAGRMTPSNAQFTGMLSFTVFVGCILLALHQGLLSAFLVASICAGIAQGLVLTGSIGRMVSGLQPQERANVFSVIYATSYIGAAIPTFISGQSSEQFSLLQIASGYGALALFSSIVLLLSRATRNQKETMRETP